MKDGKDFQCNKKSQEHHVMNSMKISSNYTQRNAYANKLTTTLLETSVNVKNLINKIIKKWTNLQYVK